MYLAWIGGDKLRINLGNSSGNRALGRAPTGVRPCTCRSAPQRAISTHRVLNESGFKSWRDSNL